MLYGSTNNVIVQTGPDQFLVGFGIQLLQLILHHSCVLVLDMCLFNSLLKKEHVFQVI